MGDDALKRRVESEMRATQHFNSDCNQVRLDAAVSVALRLVQEERETIQLLAASNDALLKRAEAAEKERDEFKLAWEVEKTVHCAKLREQLVAAEKALQEELKECTTNHKSPDVVWMLRSEVGELEKRAEAAEIAQVEHSKNYRCAPVTRQTKGEE